MSFVENQVRRIDAQLDRLQLASQTHAPFSPIASTTSARSPFSAEAQEQSLARIAHLQIVIKSLSAASSSRPLLSSTNLRWHLHEAELGRASVVAVETGNPGADFHCELEWLLVSKATTQTYGLILNTLLGQTIPLSNDIWYWDEVLGSYSYTGFYTLQTSPLRFWAWSKDVYRDARERLESIHATATDGSVLVRSLSQRWTEARKKQKLLKRLREMTASGLGVLLDEGLSFDAGEEESEVSIAGSDEHRKDEWKSIVAKSVALMETVLCNVTRLETGVSDFEEMVFTSVEDDTELLPSTGSTSEKPRPLAEKLQKILAVHMPEHITASKKLAVQYGKPSRLIRYWIPTTILILSSGTLLRILANRRAETLAWVRDLGSTVIDFWYNWVVEPLKKIIGTIRHDKDSEIAIISKDSLQGDRASLERMVVQFAIDNPDTTNGTPLGEAQITEIRTKVHEGDLTPVLKAYERDLRRPFMGTIRGELVRALLIQV
ncbi:Nuclear control of ATPase protein 2 [Lambiella insularis]|nr:Nuclear control of ATPase protein 2 [Lambiella insularis]